MSKVLYRTCRIDFLDHVVRDDNPVTCSVVGWLIKEDDTKIVLSYWLIDDPDPTVVLDHMEYITILKSCVLRRRWLK